MEKPFIIPIFIPHSGCPHRCSFCNQKAITGTYRTLTTDLIRSEIDRYLQFSTKKRKIRQIAFYGGNFLGLPDSKIQSLLSEADKYVQTGQINSIRFSTRPDTILTQKLNLLAPFPVDVIELGVQSMDDDVLQRSCRGHTSHDTIAAIELLKQYSYKIGVQLMIGLPGDTEDRSMMTATCIADLKPHFIRIYPTVVLKNSPLADDYAKGSFVPLDLDAAVSIVKKMVILFKKHDIPVIRMGLQASEELTDGGLILAGPYHPSFGHLVYSEIFLDIARKKIKELEMTQIRKSTHKRLHIHVSPKQLSIMRGIKNRNIDRLTSEFGLDTVIVSPKAADQSEDIRVHSINMTDSDGRI